VDEKEGWKVMVLDKGPAIEDSVKATMFKRFAGRPSAAVGKDASLAITTLLIERYRGNISVRDRIEGEPDQGICFEVSLPKSIPIVDWMSTYPVSKRSKGARAMTL